MRIQDPNKIIIANKKKNGLRIFCDLDGVCAFWEKAAAKTCGIDYDDQEIRDAIKNGKRLEKFVGGDEKMWPMIDKGGTNWWANLELLPWAKRLYDLLKKESNDFSFLTSPSNNPVCAAGKVEWMKKHFGSDFKDFLIGRNKHLCATPNTLLVDDDKKKCKKFRAYGGHTFQWPCPLSLIDKDIDIEEVFDELSTYIKEIR